MQQFSFNPAPFKNDNKNNLLFFKKEYIDLHLMQIPNVLIKSLINFLSQGRVTTPWALILPL